MKKILLCLIFLFPVLAFSQEVDFTDKIIAKKTLGIISSIKLDDRVGVLQINLTDTTFELIALDDKSKLLWRSSYKGYGVTCGKFNNHILAISSLGYSRSKEFINPYTAYLIDEKSGKSITEKQIFEKKAEHQELAESFFTKDNSEFNLIIRQTHKRSGSVVAYFQDKTEEISIVNLNEKLEVKTITPKVPDGTFVSMAHNPNGDFYILMYKDDKNLEAWRYEYGSTEPSSLIRLEFGSLEEKDITPNAIAASETDRNVLYLGICHDNNKNDRTLITGKFDFNSHSSKIDTEVFAGFHKRSLQNIYKPVAPDFLKPTIGYAKSLLTVKYIKESNGKIVVVLSESFFSNNMTSLNGYSVGTTSFNGYALIINCYDSSLRKLFHQLMPVKYKAYRSLTSGYNFENGSFKIVSNNQDFYMNAAYGELNMTTGEWLKLKQVTPSNGYVSDPHIIWFKDSFIVPYLGSISFSSKYNIRLYVNEY